MTNKIKKKSHSISPTRMIILFSHRYHRWTQIFPPDHWIIHPRNLNGIKRIYISTRILFLNTNFTNRTNISIRTIGLIHPHGKIRCLSVYKKIFVKFVRFVFKTHHTHGKFVFKERIRVYPCLSVCQKYSIRVQRKSVFKKAVRPSPTLQCRTQADTFILSVMPGDYHSNLPTRPLPLLHYIISQPSCHSQYTFHEASR